MKMLEDLAEVVRLSDAATPGPWSHQDSTSDTCGFDVVQKRLNGDVVAGEYGIHEYDDARFIAAAANFIRTHRATIRDMAKRLEAAERDAMRWRAFLSALRTKLHGPGHGNRIKVVEVCPMYGDEKEINDITSAIDAAMQETGR